tara:strand:- start:290 stop:559 length:270 start_codon:yes stop_codon:yes gene_type:complete
LLRNVFLKTLRDQRRALCWWAAGVAALGRTIIGDVTDLTSPEGYLNSQLYVFMVPLVYLVFTVGRSSGAITGEEELGTLELLLSCPIRR